MSTSENTRLQVVFDDLQSTIADLIIKHGVTEQEFQQVIAWALDVAEAGEIPMTIYQFFMHPVLEVNLGAAYANPEKDGASPWIGRGPAYVPGAPVLERPYALPMRPDEPGEALFVSGQVRSTSGEPIAGAELDIWMTNAKGDYSNLTAEMIRPLVIDLDESLPPFNLRGKLLTDDEGRFEYRTVMPGIEVMGIDEDGPLGRLIKKLDRVDTRPLHIHAIVTAAGFHTLTTQSHFEGDPRVGNTLEPRTTPESSVHATQLHDDPADFKARGLDAPYHTVTHDFVLRPVTPAV
ncbi:catechol 1,2-dioxygenase [Streptomyces ipomoeae]|uniref:dioxygenase family protein n=1 Tax=Streptomyces ipomoeae TaxID=103232 RepID=UPI001146C5E6|nr:catechol 1,2-dioxygenase [Streptomyces ipomoeae]MDX2935561.1 catechol 1,2-dioxygenase [Streptomyces ipomoeae]TQE18383.1 catechol 1,2-dioxygenase [Streptomyces ipomoeae]